MTKTRCKNNLIRVTQSIYLAEKQALDVQESITISKKLNVALAFNAYLCAPRSLDDARLNSDVCLSA